MPLLQTFLRLAVKVSGRAECLAAIRSALEAGADVNARSEWGWTPLLWAVWVNTDTAAVTAAVELLVATGANVLAKDDFGTTGLHMATCNSNAKAAAAAVQALLAAGANALAKTTAGWTPLRCALRMNQWQAAGALLAAMPAGAALKDLCAAETPAARRLLPAFVASRLPLTAAQWALIPVAPTPGLARALPAALACSGNQARQLVRRLPPAETQRLRTAALCLVRMQRSEPLWPQQYLPLAIVERILCAAVDDS